MTTEPPPTWADFSAAVRAKIARDLEREAADAAALRADVVPRVVRAVTDARAEGLCGRAWLFGSFAWGEPRERSDVDLLLEACTDPFRVASRVAEACGREVHAVTIESAPKSLRERVVTEGRPL